MSFNTFCDTIKESDTVILSMGKSNLSMIKIEAGKIHQTKYGAFPHSKMIGKKFGTRIACTREKGFMYMLHPTPELWTVTLPHRTQILYTTDISQIIFELEIKPGSVVIESGTGSGSLSHAIIRAVKPLGHLYTFDFHELRTQSAAEEFKEHGIEAYVTSGCRDVLANGFDMTNAADAVFLDLPAPWDAVSHAKKAIKSSGGRLCSFSPCIEQVQRTCTALRKHRFTEIRTIECLTRFQSVRTSSMPEARLSIGNQGNNSVESVTKDDSGICPAESITQVGESIPATKKEVAEDIHSEGQLTKDGIAVCPAEDGIDVCPAEDATQGKESLSAIKKDSIEELTCNSETNGISPAVIQADTSPPVIQADTSPPVIQADNWKRNRDNVKSACLGSVDFLTAGPYSASVTGHTGYLTFASLYPSM